MSMTVHDSNSFAAGQDCGARTAACVARLTALELVDGAHWWNRWRRRLMAGALVACAVELELSADEDRRGAGDVAHPVQLPPLSSTRRGGWTRPGGAGAAQA